MTLLHILLLVTLCAALTAFYMQRRRHARETIRLLDLIFGRPNQPDVDSRPDSRQIGAEEAERLETSRNHGGAESGTRRSCSALATQAITKRQDAPAPSGSRRQAPITDNNTFPRPWVPPASAETASEYNTEHAIDTSSEPVPTLPNVPTSALGTVQATFDDRADRRHFDRHAVESDEDGPMYGIPSSRLPTPPNNGRVPEFGWDVRREVRESREKYGEGGGMRSDTCGGC